MDNLKPCPFCGADARRFDIQDGDMIGGSGIECSSCMATTAVHFDRKENLESSWNDRTFDGSKAELDVLRERDRQVEEVGWTPEHDDGHDKGELALAGASYAVVSALSEDRRKSVSGIFSIVNNAMLRDLWPFAHSWWKPKDRRCDLVRAGALIIAEIERLDRAAEREGREQAEAKANG